MANPNGQPEPTGQPAHDPVGRHPRPEFPAQSQEHPGTGAAMRPQPDHGEESYRGSGRLLGRGAIVTGGDSGIGRAVAIAFAREGADVLISHLPEEEKDAVDTVRLIEEAGRVGMAVAGDIREEAHCRSLVDRALTAFGRLDIVVNNAAYQMARPGGIEEISTEQLDRVFKTNVYAMFWLCQAAVPHLRPGSSIINTTSIQAYQPSPPLLDYASTKGAIVTFTKGLSEQLAPRGIRVNAVAPGPVWTPLIPATMPEESVKSFGGSTVFGRPAQPAELAPAYVFLASEEAQFVTAEIMNLTGGQPLP
ncbi:SDR family oxidoreductase [Allostreptomyces psammosilenae]|uniref:Uncharacterized protein n=1 Tax=Allostreptomyces psammosilenae TaxID=1892865 RepID=A0A852ZS71_9ACTN|nr:SDR family oxidoreductase [Allostreptomyces psammosilenae]NYI03694.1 hypothetical protein [Allostreptomyces psammosilenae]